MHFQHPELLYALLLLIIPLIVHLFRLRKFQKEDFTNVKFLKKVIQETRKSSRLKKFLILITRLLLISCLVLAFAKPFIPASDKALADSHTLIYLDNSYSMQAGSTQNSVFNRSINSLMENLETENKYGLFTNNSEYFGHTAAELRDLVQEIEYSPKQAKFQEILLKAQNYFKKFPNTQNELVLISDFQNTLEIPSELSSKNFSLHMIKQSPGEINNISLDTAFISNSNAESVSIKILASSSGLSNQPVSVSVFNGQTLLGRKSVEFSEEKTAGIEFRLENRNISSGLIELEDSGLKYDNQLYFNVEENPVIKVVVVSNRETDFLTRIYSEPEFETRVFPSDQIDFNQLNSANLVVLNEIELLPSSLINNLANVSRNGASVVIIPNLNATNYPALLNSFGFSSFQEKIETDRLITNISFDHPLLENVFEDRIDNFDYPKVLSSYNLPARNAVLNYQDNRPFLTQSSSVYLFTAAINNENSNFKNSPLIVPVFYQIGLNALKKKQLYYSTQEDNLIDIPAELSPDRVLLLSNSTMDVIPQQQNFSNRVEINTGNLSLEAGNYQISNNDRKIGAISFNHSREESELLYSDLNGLENVSKYTSVQEYFSDTKAASEITSLWKWFVIFALILLAIEMLLIKFLK